MNQAIITTITDFREQRAAEFGIVRIGLFGSAARGSSHAGSDIDIVVEMREPDLLKLVGIKQELEELLHRNVDIVRYRVDMNPFLRQRIDREAIYV
ncbi:MAG: nucleotidyltransferase domain-containing protein [Caldilineaceae bacterium]|nr:nucleotidyltransferase domain-containing protein [Caldilineaceae bacterium]